MDMGGMVILRKLTHRIKILNLADLGLVMCICII